MCSREQRRRAGRGVTTHLSPSPGLTAVLALASSNEASPGRERDSEGCLNHQGFPWARLGLCRLPVHVSGHGDGEGDVLEGMPRLGTFSCRAATDGKQHGGEMWHQQTLLLRQFGVCIRGLFSLHWCCNPWLLPC